MKKKKKKKWIFIVLAVVVVLFIYIYIQGQNAVGAMYTEAIAQRGDLDIYYSFSGTTQIDEAQKITTVQSWKLDSINVKEGDKVKAGDILYVVNEEDYALAVRQAEVALASAELSLSNTQASMRQQISQAESSMNTARMSMEDALTTFESTQQLYDAGMVSQQNYDQVKMAYEVAAEQYNTAQVAYSTLANSTAGISIASAQKQVDQAQSSYDTLVKQIGDREVKSEIDGIVSKIHVNPGVTLNAGTVIMDILDTDSMRAVVKVDEYDYYTMLVGTEVSVLIDALDLEIPGKVASIDMQATGAQGISYFNAEVEFENDERVLSGMSAEVKSLKDSTKDTVLIDMDVLSFDKANQPYVLYKDEKGTLQSKYVTVGINDGFTVEILEGVSEGEALYYIDMSSYYQMMNMMGGY